MSIKGAVGPTHREEVTERYVREDLVRSVLRALTLALSPELLQSLQQGPRGAEEKGVLLGDGVVQRGVIAVTMQPATESRPRSPGVLTKGFLPLGGRRPRRPPRTTGRAEHVRCVRHVNQSSGHLTGETHQAGGFVCGHRAGQCPLRSQARAGLGPRPKAEKMRKDDRETQNLVFKRPLRSSHLLSGEKFFVGKKLTF